MKKIGWKILSIGALQAESNPSGMRAAVGQMEPKICVKSHSFQWNCNLLVLFWETKHQAPGSQAVDKLKSQGIRSDYFWERWGETGLGFSPFRVDTPPAGKEESGHGPVGTSTVSHCFHGPTHHHGVPWIPLSQLSRPKVWNRGTGVGEGSLCGDVFQ